MLQGFVCSRALQVLLPSVDNNFTILSSQGFFGIFAEFRPDFVFGKVSCRQNVVSVKWHFGQLSFRQCVFRQSVMDSIVLSQAVSLECLLLQAMLHRDSSQVPPQGSSAGPTPQISQPPAQVRTIRTDTSSYNVKSE